MLFQAMSCVFPPVCGCVESPYRQSLLESAELYGIKCGTFRWKMPMFFIKSAVLFFTRTCNGKNACQYIEIECYNLLPNIPDKTFMRFRIEECSPLFSRHIMAYMFVLRNRRHSLPNRFPLSLSSFCCIWESGFLEIINQRFRSTFSDGFTLIVWNSNAAKVCFILRIQMKF